MFSQKQAADKYEEFVRSNSPTAQVVLDIERIISSNRWRCAFFGGSARDIILDGGDAKPRDLDIVVDGATQSELEAVFKLRHRTAFGGLKGHVNDVSIDMWPLNTTWAFTGMGLEKPTFQDLMGSTPFNIEAIAIEPTISPRVYEGGFFSCMTDKVLEINHRPSVLNMPGMALVRAARFVKRFDLKVGPELRSYLDQIDWRKFSPPKLLAVQTRYYGNEVIPSTDICAILGS